MSQMISLVDKTQGTCRRPFISCHLPMSFYIYEWEHPRRDTKLTCGHKPTGKTYKVILSACHEDVMVLPQAIETALQAKPTKPALLYRLWHWCFGKKAKPSAPRVLDHR